MTHETPPQPEALDPLGDPLSVAILVGKMRLFADLVRTDHPEFRGWASKIEEWADQVATLDAARLPVSEALGLVDRVIFDLPIGIDVTYSRGYSDGVAAARESLRTALREAATLDAARLPVSGESDASDPRDPANGPEWHTGKPCIEQDCDKPAGTAWSPYWCKHHNTERLARIAAGFDAALAGWCDGCEPCRQMGCNTHEANPIYPGPEARTEPEAEVEPRTEAGRELVKAARRWVVEDGDIAIGAPVPVDLPGLTRLILRIEEQAHPISTEPEGLLDDPIAATWEALQNSNVPFPHRATIRAALATQSRGLDVRESGDGFEVRTWVKHEPSGVVVLPGHPQLGGRYCQTDGGDWPCAAVRAAIQARSNRPR